MQYICAACGRPKGRESTERVFPSGYVMRMWTHGFCDSSGRPIRAGKNTMERIQGRYDDLKTTYDEGRQHYAEERERLGPEAHDAALDAEMAGLSTIKEMEDASATHGSNL